MTPSERQELETLRDGWRTEAKYCHAAGRHMAANIYTICADHLHAFLSSHAEDGERQGWQSIATAPQDNWELRNYIGGWHHETLGWLFGKVSWSPPGKKTLGWFYTDNGGTPTHCMKVPAPLSTPEPST